MEAEEFIADAIFAAERHLPTNNFYAHGLTLHICRAFSIFFWDQCVPIIVHQGCPSNN